MCVSIISAEHTNAPGSFKNDCYFPFFPWMWDTVTIMFCLFCFVLFCFVFCSCTMHTHKHDVVIHSIHTERNTQITSPKPKAQKMMFSLLWLDTSVRMRVLNYGVKARTLLRCISYSTNRSLCSIHIFHVFTSSCSEGRYTPKYPRRTNVWS